eukprot:GHVL01025105.1.p1 GENE.GHVL01025105.1~~GHVL01025105.1.p1  ORF type:complete len:145 (+),score=4.69 GHVL01025105.1:51-437(+)
MWRNKIETSLPQFRNSLSGLRFAHRRAVPAAPNLEALRKIVHQKLRPIHFEIKFDFEYGTFPRDFDHHFKGILCSPLFEGKSYEEINKLVDDTLDEIGLKGFVRLHCQPPSRYHKMHRMKIQRWNMEK